MGNTNNHKEVMRYDRVLLFFAFIGIILVIIGISYYYQSPPKISSVMYDMSNKQLPPSVFCKLVEKGLNSRTSYSWNCSVDNNSYSYSDNGSIVYNLTKPLCECSTIIDHRPYNIEVRASKPPTNYKR